VTGMITTMGSVMTTTIEGVMIVTMTMDMAGKIMTGDSK